MDIGKAFSFVFEDERWVSKVLIGGLLSIVPILNFVVLGYSLKTAQNVAQGNPRPLPEWDDFGGHFMRGLHWLVVYLVYLLPALILYFLFFCVLAAAGGAADRGRDDGAAGAIGLLGLCLMPIVFLLALGGAVLSFAALARYIATNKLSEAFKFSEVIATVRGDLGTWFMLLLVVILAGFVSSLGVIGCGIGVIFTTFYSYCVDGHALGQVVARQMGQTDGYAAPPQGYTPPPTY